jgi:integrase
MTVQTRRQSSKVVLNKSTIAGLHVPPAGRIYYHDARQPGLCVCVTAAGARTFYLYRWDNGRPLRQRLGATDELTVEQARTKAKTLTGESVLGVDIRDRKRAAREELTFGELFGRWMEYAKEHKRTWPEDQRKYDKFLLTWAARRLSNIDATDVERLHNAVRIKSGPYQANRVLEMVKAMFRRALDQRYWKGENPAGTIKKFEEHSRERFLRPEEMKRFFEALAAALPDQQDFFLLLLLTGQRRGAVQAMRWADIDLDEGIWSVPAAISKNKQPITLPLVPRAVEVLAGRQNESEYVFPSHGKTGHLVEPKRGWQEIVAAAGLGGLRIHDLRRTLGSWQASAGVSLGIIGKSLGHAHGSRATNVYARLDLEPVRAAVTAATTAIIKAGSPKPIKKRRAK